MTAVVPTTILSNAPANLHVLGLTVEQYDCLIDQGQIAEGAAIELLDGMMVLKDRSHAGADPMSVGELHAWVIDSLQDLRPEVAAIAGSLRTQVPIVLQPSHELEPDGSIVRGNKADYLRRHPTADDVLCVIEAADSSLATDRTTKLRIYANAAIPVYVIVNIPDRVLERRADPAPGTGTYGTMERIRPGGVLRLPLADGQHLDVPADRLIPPA